MRKLYLPDGTDGGGDAAAKVSDEDVHAIKALREQNEVLRKEMARVIIGQDEVIEKMLICILSRGHSLLMGVPGLAKTMMVNSLSQIMSLEFSRIQFTTGPHAQRHHGHGDFAGQ